MVGSISAAQPQGNTAPMKRRNGVKTLRHCADLSGSDIEVQISRADSDVFDKYANRPVRHNIIIFIFVVLHKIRV